MPADFVVEAVDSEDGSRTELYACDTSADARAWLRGYVSKENAGNWDLIEIYDVRGCEECGGERIKFWERNAA